MKVGEINRFVCSIIPWGKWNGVYYPITGSKDPDIEKADSITIITGPQTHDLKNMVNKYITKVRKYEEEKEGRSREEDGAARQQND